MQRPLINSHHLESSSQSLSWRNLLLLWLGFISCCFVAASAAANVTNAAPVWVELGDKGKIIVRAIVAKAQACPVLNLDHKPSRMAMRAQAKELAFPINVCEAIVPEKTQSVSVNGQTLVLPKNNPHRIIIIGDTGCRIKKGVVAQACRDPQRWPFAKIAKQAAALKPDLVIHVGDYLYREVPCSSSETQCVGSPYGDTWQTWNEDFFKPAKPLLNVAPWIVARGNHESCERAGNGWFRLLAPSAYTPQCNNFTPAYSIPLQNRQLVIIDTSAAKDGVASAKAITFFTSQLQVVQNLKQDTWLITHKPLWFTLHPRTRLPHQEYLYPTLAEIAELKLPTNLKLIFAGHIHRFQTVNFAKFRSPQVIIGNSGTALDKTLLKAPLSIFELAKGYIPYGMLQEQFGFLALEQHEQQWSAQLYNVEGKVIVKCKLWENQFECFNNKSK